jgi:hypothetical protein
MIRSFALAQKHAGSGEPGTCAAFSGLPSEDNDTAGMVFIRGGNFVMGSEAIGRKSASATSCAYVGSGQTSSALVEHKLSAWSPKPDICALMSTRPNYVNHFTSAAG